MRNAGLFRPLCVLEPAKGGEGRFLPLTRNPPNFAGSHVRAERGTERRRIAQVGLSRPLCVLKPAKYKGVRGQQKAGYLSINGAEWNIAAAVSRPLILQLSPKISPARMSERSEEPRGGGLRKAGLSRPLRVLEPAKYSGRSSCQPLTDGSPKISPARMSERSEEPRGGGLRNAGLSRSLCALEPTGAGESIAVTIRFL